MMILPVYQLERFHQETSLKIYSLDTRKTKQVIFNIMRKDYHKLSQITFCPIKASLLNCVPCVLKMCLHANVLCAFTCSRANVSCVLMYQCAFRASVITCQPGLLAHVATCQHALSPLLHNGWSDHMITHSSMFCSYLGYLST